MMPVHMHVAEQTGEVDQCLAWCGQRPVEWLLSAVPVDGRWCLIHATHMTEAETRALAASDAVAGLCPTTEANLGDGVFALPAYLAAGGKIAIGSDSHVSVSPWEELRWLEYGQRLVHRRRHVASLAPASSVGATLLHLTLAGGAQALGRPTGRIEMGSRADLVVLDPTLATLAGLEADKRLDAAIFSGNRMPVRDVMVGGVRVVEDGRHGAEEAVEAAFRAALARLDL
jgi:formimidoylglutamate deiminase